MKVFVDMDGVLVDFHRPAMDKHGIKYDIYPPQAGWDIVEACNIIQPGSNMTGNKFWRAFDEDFWATLPKTNHCDALLRTVESYVGQDNVCLLTSGMWPEAAAGKTKWVNNNLPRRYKTQLLIGYSKYFVASSDSLLIDDRDLNVEDFRAHGGSAILVPRPWNTMWRNRLPMCHVYKELCIMFGRGGF
jgi:5'(3')-deoxyribonucleotidase